MDLLIGEMIARSSQELITWSVFFIMNYFGGYESEIEIPGSRSEFLPSRSAAKYQPLDLGLISHSKIRYRSSLLRIAIDVLMGKIAANKVCTTDSNRSFYRMREFHKHMR